MFFYLCAVKFYFLKVSIPFLLFLIVLLFASCQKKECNSFQDMYSALPQNKNFDSLYLKNKIMCNFRVYYILENKDSSSMLVVSMFDKNTDFRLKEYRKKLPNIAKENGILEQEILNGILFKTRNFCKTVITAVESCEKKEEFTSFEQTQIYKAGYTTNRLDAVIKSRYFLTIYLLSSDKKQHFEFKKYINPYFHRFNFNKLKN